MKKSANIWKWLAKAGAAGLCALGLACVVCLVYYNLGVHVTNKTGITDYVWEPNVFTVRMTEGITWDRFDKNGFCNNEVIDHNMDILLMGSSHMEGLQVFSEERTNTLLAQSSNKSVYNIGMSGHALLRVVQNLDKALSIMRPKEYVIIETQNTKFDVKAIDAVLQGKLPRLKSYDKGLVFHLQHVPYLRLLYLQLETMRKNQNSQVKQMQTGGGTGAKLA